MCSFLVGSNLSGSADARNIEKLGDCEDYLQSLRFISNYSSVTSSARSSTGGSKIGHEDHAGEKQVEATEKTLSRYTIWDKESTNPNIKGKTKTKRGPATPCYARSVKRFISREQESIKMVTRSCMVYKRFQSSLYRSEPVRVLLVLGEALGNRPLKFDPLA